MHATFACDLCMQPIRGSRKGIQLRHIEFGNEMFGWWAAPYNYNDGFNVHEFKWDPVDYGDGSVGSEPSHHISAADKHMAGSCGELSGGFAHSGILCPPWDPLPTLGSFAPHGILCPPWDPGSIF